MSGNSQRQTIDQVIDSSPTPALKDSTYRRPLGYVVGALVLWLIGTLYMIGFHMATSLQPHFALSIGDGAAMLLVGVIAIVVGRAIKKPVHGVETGVALAIGLIMALTALTVGFASGGVWCGIGGAYPDGSHLGNMISRSVTGHETR